MNNVLALTKKELKSYFNSPTAYIILILFLIITGWFFSSGLFIESEASLRSIMGIIPFTFLFFIPAITMKLLSEEKKSGTLELLVTMPLSDIEIIVGKFLAAFILINIAISATVTYAFTIGTLGNPDYGVIISGYIGLSLMSASYVAIGVFTSSITNNQIVSFIVSFTVLFVLFLFGKIIIFLPSFLAGIFEYLSSDYHFNNISRGVIDSRDLVYYFSIIFLSLWGASQSLEKRKK